MGKQQGTLARLQKTCSLVITLNAFGRERFLVKLYIVESDINNDKVTLLIKVSKFAK